MHVRQLVSSIRRKGLDSCVILIAWMIWKERNSRVFEKVDASSLTLLHRTFDEFRLWHASGLDCMRSLPLIE